MARLLEEGGSALLKEKLLIFNAFVMMNQAKIHALMRQHCVDKTLRISTGNNYDDIFRKRIRKVLQ